MTRTLFLVVDLLNFSLAQQTMRLGAGGRKDEWRAGHSHQGCQSIEPEPNSAVDIGHSCKSDSPFRGLQMFNPFPRQNKARAIRGIF